MSLRKKDNNNVKHMEKILDEYLHYVNVFKEHVEGEHVEGEHVEGEGQHVEREFKKEELEMEIKFGTGRNMKEITRLDYDNVIKRVLSAGFKHSSEETLLRIFSVGGSIKNERVRIEISDIGNISEYCKTNRLTNANGDFIAKIVEKKDFVSKIVPHVDFEDFNFKASLKTEGEYYEKSLIVDEVTKKWSNVKKTFRYISRNSFIHPDFPVKIDISVVKQRNGGVYNFIEADLMNSRDIYEIEIELVNDKLKKEVNTDYKTSDLLYKMIKKVITIILSGIQRTNFPISNSEQDKIGQEYMAIVFGKNYNKNGMDIKTRDFIGPSSYTLQIENIAIDSDKNTPNIRNNYTVTEKADGERKMLFINGTGRMYFIDSNMNIQFTGAIIDNTELFNTLIDGELISHNKNKQFINSFMAFDIYICQNKDLRGNKFVDNKYIDNKYIASSSSSTDSKKRIEYRLDLLQSAVIDIKTSMNSVSGNKNSLFRISVKHFEVSSPTRSIFECCKQVLKNKHLFEYEIDGLIFTPANFAVGMNSETEIYKPETSKKTWNSSFKWKPIEYNTIDFLLTIKKDQGIDKISRLNPSGIDVSSTSPIIEYKTVTLHVGFDEKKDGYINPMKDMIEDKMYDENNKESYKPVQFYPTNPYDANAGICNLLLSSDEKQIFSEEGNVIEDKMIVEFRYDKERNEGWRWIPLRVRYDKTADLRANGRNFGNAYRVANSNWHSIHYPVTEHMISNGMNDDDDNTDIINIQNEDVYYKGDKSANETQGLRDFHNKYVKKMLIENVSKPGNTLIDLAVGKAGDLHKWTSARLSFVLGVDISPDNIINRIDGACARYLNTMKKTRGYKMPKALFIIGDSSKNIKSGEALVGDNRIIANAVFGKGVKDENKLGKGIYNNFGVGKEGFDICSIQFAIHYMFENMYKLTNFLRNVSENTKKDGYFIATCYDGRTIFNKLKNLKKGESNIIKSSINNDKKIWSIKKQYDATVFEDNDSCLGYAIDVYQDTIDKEFREYLVNYTFLNKLLNDYGFDKIEDDEAKNMNLSSGSGMFNSLHMQMMTENKNDARHKYGYGVDLSDKEKEISYLNRYFVYKKRRNVDTEDITKSLMRNYNVIMPSAAVIPAASPTPAAAAIPAPAVAIPVAAIPAPALAIPVAAIPAPAVAIPVAAIPAPALAIPVAAIPAAAIPAAAIPAAAIPAAAIPAAAIPAAAIPDATPDSDDNVINIVLKKRVRKNKTIPVVVEEKKEEGGKKIKLSKKKTKEEIEKKEKKKKVSIKKISKKVMLTE